MTDLSENGWLAKRWKAGTLAVWLAVAVLMIFAKMPDIAALALGDTDDNLRLAQVRALLGGQAWYDLVQYRLAPPEGANIHWSHLPDLPIAGLFLLLEPMLGTAWAERWAVALAPLLPFAIGLFALGLIARRIIDPVAWPLALLAAFCAGILMPMWMPLRIDHHGWQLAMLAVALAGLVDPHRARGGVTSGIATAVSLTIGLEMLVFLALIGAATALYWVRDRVENARIAAYGASLGGGAALGFALFASNANRLPVCDALSPVWLSAVAGAGALLVLLAILPLHDWRARLGAGALAGGLLAIGFALIWPDCLSRPEGVSAELQAMWLDNVREARPLYHQSIGRALIIVALPLSGLAGYLVAAWQARGETERLVPLLALTAIMGIAILLLFWQVRIAPAAQLIAVPGAAIVGWHLLPRWRRSENMVLRIGGSLAAVAVMTGFWIVLPAATILQAADTEDDLAVAANGVEGPACPSAAALAPVGDLPRGTVLAPVDLGPRLIVMTHHDAIAGPYHRNGPAMLDIFHAFREDAGRMAETVARYDVDYVLLCPKISGEKLYGSDDSESMYAQLMAGTPPDWLERVELPEDSPFRMWRVR